ncbi:MAG: hypothetical protein L6R36_008978 [Xanthoria steineri]|nr:MAG: hypothetical protein L6R36_008978 [Xanthoria steineri]
MPKIKEEHGYLCASNLPPREWPANTPSSEGSKLEQPLYSDGTTGNACLREDPRETLYLECTDKEYADEENEAQGQDEDEGWESDFMSDQVTASDSEASENGSFRSESPKPCECGYVSYDSDWDSSSDDEPESDCLGYPSEDDGLSKSYRHYVTCRANKEPFPLERLPPEIRLMIFRLAMQDERFRPLQELGCDSDDKHVGRMFGFDDAMEQRTALQARQYSLLKVQGFIANEARAVFHNEVYFRMDISPFGISSRPHLTDHLENFDKDDKLAPWTELQNHRHYHLNIKSNAVRWVCRRDATQDPVSYEHGSFRVKEWIRLVSDELLANTILRHLTITAPCRCALEAAGRLPKDEASILDLFTPLKRIRVPNPVVLSLYYDICQNGIEHPCSKFACLQSSHDIQAMLSR